MTSSSNLYRRSSGIYVVRLVVPERHRTEVGKREIHVSTGSTDLAVAKTLGAGVLAHWRQKLLDLGRLQSMDVERLKAGSPALTLSSFLPLIDAGKHSGLGEDQLLRLAAEGKLKLYFRSRGVDGYFVRCEDLELDDPTTGTLDIPPPHLMPEAARAAPAPQMLAFRNPKAVASELLCSNSVELVFFDIAGRHDVGFAPNDAIKVTRGSIEVDTAEVNAVRSRLASAVTPTHVRLARTSRPTSAGGNPKGNKRLSDAVTAYIGERANRCSPDQARRIQGALDLFVELIGDRKIDEVDRDLIKDYRDKKLPMVPANENKIRLSRKTASVSESIQAVDGICT